MNEGESLGKVLRREREARNLSLKEAARATKVRERLLRALEEDEHHLLPSPTYVKGFLLAYAKYLGLDSNRVLEHYENALKGPPAAEMPEPPSSVKPRRTGLTLGAAAGVVILAIVFIYLLYPSSPRIESVPGKPEATEGPSPSRAAATSDPGAKADAGANAGTRATPAEEKAFSLKLRATERTWISVKIDDQPEQEMTLQPGEEVVREGRRRIHLVVGNAGGLEVTHNGTVIERFGNSGDVVILTCTPEGVTELNRHKRSKPPE